MPPSLHTPHLKTDRFTEYMFVLVQKQLSRAPDCWIHKQATVPFPGPALFEEATPHSLLSSQCKIRSPQSPPWAVVEKEVARLTVALAQVHLYFTRGNLHKIELPWNAEPSLLSFSPSATIGERDVFPHASGMFCECS